MPILFKGVNEGECPIDLVATHQRVLLGAALRTDGPILELGTGWYSTPLLHEVAVNLKRYVVTLDTSDYWLQQFKADRWSAEYGYKGDRYHTLRSYPFWEDAKLRPADYGLVAERWGLVFADHGQPIERYYVVRELLKVSDADVFVFHDAEDRDAYGYSRTFDRFKYLWIDDCQKAQTAVASNVIDVTKWFCKLPRVAHPPKEET